MIFDQVTEPKSLCAIAQLTAALRARYKAMLMFMHLGLDNMKQLLKVIAAGQENNNIRHLRSLTFGGPLFGPDLVQNYTVPYDCHLFPMSYDLPRDLPTHHDVQLGLPEPEPTVPSSSMSTASTSSTLVPHAPPEHSRPNTAVVALQRMKALEYLTFFGYSQYPIVKRWAEMFALLVHSPRKMRWRFEEAIGAYEEEDVHKRMCMLEGSSADSLVRINFANSGTFTHSLTLVF